VYAVRPNGETLTVTQGLNMPVGLDFFEGDLYISSIFKIVRIENVVANLNGSGLERVAAGVRNTVGFDWHPETGELWFTDNGRDLMGENIPPDELNRAPEP
jgi:glucose/arabinose dehydrogenase